MWLMPDKIDWIKTGVVGWGGWEYHHDSAIVEDIYTIIVSTKASTSCMEWQSSHRTIS